MIQANSINEIRFYRCYCKTVLFNGIIQRVYINDVQNDRAG